ncbi:acetylornithine deacetylase/succinyl-diaminopimelate desuccinylase-like protein [Actinomycetospora succinea]|uniref:Acetylornithine deacetylase/succinyl-diaminopimelate desuccinylase-like protein n=1 Tax=Actinomycetospora succinea TaxID=663603 RepID=A0A4R6VKJ4_9PSEU|nr:M20/M25/M40 family metallo-hydrolase [Actinomycetospora succinea]TDQ62359.1 acetylornithine deacetylase/succinyl-diaminopimelate desuccinylase-like protein [Actinomycetospora succinea]
MSAPAKPSTLTEQQRRWVDDACSRLDAGRLTELVVGMVDIPSPTGEEGPLAEWLAGQLDAAGLAGRVQPLDDRQANAHGRLAGDGTGESLLLYAPIDTFTVGDPAEDVPWIGPELRTDMQPRAQVHGDHVLGLGASNPKGHGAAVVAAAEAIATAGIPLRGDLLVGLGAGGMPTNGRDARGLTRRNTGQGVGASFLLEQGVWADHAVIAKPGWAVAWEEVGLCWFEVRVRGAFSYVGSRHRMPYRNPIAHAATVIDALERWFPEYAAWHTDGLVAPQGIVASVEGGWPRLASATSALCRFTVDLRTSPRSTPADVRREFGAAIAAITAGHPELDVDWEMVLAIPGTHTPQDAPVVAAAIAAWEDLAGREHAPIVANSGATDANILRTRGLPTARIGMDRIGPDAPIPLDFPAGMNVVDIREALRLARHLVHTAVSLCTRERTPS